MDVVSTVSSYMDAEWTLGSGVAVGIMNVMVAMGSDVDI